MTNGSTAGLESADPSRSNVAEDGGGRRPTQHGYKGEAPQECGEEGGERDATREARGGQAQEGERSGESLDGEDSQVEEVTVERLQSMLGTDEDADNR